MTKAQIADTVMSGVIMCGAEWRSCKAAVSEIEDDRTKVKKVVKAIVHQVEIGEMPYEIKQEIPEEKLAAFSVEAYNAGPRPFKKGDSVVLRLKSYGWSNFKKKYLGKGEPLPVTDK